MAMQDGYVNSTILDGVATVTFHHPKSNSLPGQVLRAMADAISAAGKDHLVRVIVLRSEGDKAFCAGASFDELVAINTVDEGLRFFNGFAQVINAIRTVPVLVLGRIHAHAVGGGVGLACAVDIAYAHEKASVRLSELAIGIGPFVVGPAVERKVGVGTFGLLSATPALRRDADWCVQHGLYAEHLPTIEALDARIEAHTRELVGYSPDAMAELKKVLWRGTEDWDTLLAERAEISGRLVLSHHTREAIGRFKATAAKR
ncbi:MAG: enoyl-CoA hydratase/isomerase family protein [Flavobacteriales bacterium]|jgi:methylglutaconyl-CoA hydratase|nr:enoyl-CoA hydratase/isomerase family protein [Flavobacteriales bacterium]MBK6550882.1 enoyl-CoA hydratase/isomerase family protein [Flavobacteriales bacterium]MBK6882437.1 enoyl-CoA hydratase/isomerase family protein [Flavobacteriales bacterium]MBK7101349.1 enoyl-CoA hydratase/isomerase family protein [Flavobacteriales bacterium]MBK7112057.1 enoyl-CoA hydratase/isomerase family protein [Flavobacteriales bacterium]